jgi:carnitine 3-dehydrogenase
MKHALLPLESIKTVGLAGAGAVGYGWASLLLARGYDVVAFDPADGLEERLASAVVERWPALRAMGLAVDEPPLDRLSCVDSIGEMASKADLVQENGPENPQIKGAILAEIDEVLPADRLILSSSGGVPPSDLENFCRHPHRVLVGHPFHPAHIIPLVEVVGGWATSKESVDLAISFYERLGKKPIRLKREMVGHLANRLQFALLREASYCLAEGVASAADIDGAVRWGLGPRWALMGCLMSWNLAGGEGGLESLFERFAGDVQRWWDALGTTQLTPEVREALVEGARELQGDRTIADWSAWRDTALIDFAGFTAAHPYPGDNSQHSPRAQSPGVATDMKASK